MSITANAAFETIKYIESTEAGGLRLSRSKFDSQLLNLLVESERLKVEDIDRALESSVVLEAKRAVKILSKKGSFTQYTDHASNEPQYITYAIKHGYLDRKELKVLTKHLDHSKDLDEFCTRYPAGEDMIPKLREKLLTPPKPIKWDDDSYIDPHPACLDH